VKNISYKRYIETFHILEGRSEEYGYQLKHLLKETENLQDGFSILDIGAGTGQFARSFIEKSKVKTGLYVAIEPSKEHIKSLKKNIASFAGEKNITWGKFTPKTTFKNKFDLIIMSHSIYWFVPNINEHLLNAVRHLSKGGRLIIYMQTFASFCYILNVFLRGADPIYPHRISSREVTKILNEHKIDHDISYLPGTLIADGLFLPKNKKLLDDLISFCIFTEADDLSNSNLKFAEDLCKLLSYKTNAGLKLNLSIAAIAITKKG